MTSEHPPRGLRGHRVQNVEIAEDKRRALVLAAARVFAQRGYWSTSLDQVADELGWTKGAIYYYFASKEDLFLEIQSRSLTEATARLDSVVAAGGSPDVLVRRVLAGLIHNIVHGLDRYAVLLTEAHVLSEQNRLKMRDLQRRFEATVQAIVEQGIREGRFVAGNPKLMTFTLLRGSLGVADWFNPDGAWPSETIVESVTDQLLRGILVPGLVLARDLGHDGLPSEASQ